MDDEPMKKEPQTNIRIVAIKGSVRPGNYTSKALNLCIDELGSYPDVTVQVFDPSDMHLPFPGQNGGFHDAEKLRAAVSEATGVILSTPEYHGGYSSVIKLVIENLGFPSTLAGKPVALLGVAAGSIGAIKSLESLRSICSHVGAIVLPGPVSVAGVQKKFDEQGNCLDESTEKRIRSLATHLLSYIKESVCPKEALEAMVRAGTV
jgi:FMN reductase